MRNLLSADLMRLKKPWFLYAAGVTALVVLVNQYWDKARFGRNCPMDETLMLGFMLAGFLLCIFCGLFAGSEYESGGIRHQIIAGHTRPAIYLSHLITALGVGAAAAAAYMILGGGLGALLLDPGKKNAGQIVTETLCGLLSVAACASLFHMIAMTTENRAKALLLCVLVFLSMFFLATFIEGRLEEPEMVSGYMMTVNGVRQSDPEPNPRYLQPGPRQFCEFLMALLPMGTQLQLTIGNFYQTGLSLLCSLFVTGVATGIGLMLFRKKDVK